MYFPRHQTPFFRGYAHRANTEGTASKLFPRSDRPAFNRQRSPTKLHPSQAKHFPAIPLTENQHLAPLSPEAQWHRQRSAMTLPMKRSGLAKEAASLYKSSQMTSPKKRTIFPKQAIRNLRLQPLDARQKALDGHQQALYGHPKPANGDFSIEQRR